MTNISTDHPYGIPYIELTDKGRKISFERDCLADVKIQRKVNNENWATLIERARSPYTDADNFPAGTRLTYSIELQHEGQQKQYELQATL